MKKVLFGLMGLALMILMASAYSITRLQTPSQSPITSNKNQESSELTKIEKTIEHLKVEIAEIENLEKKIQSAQLDEALKAGVELNQKLKQAGSLAALQANLELLNEMKKEYQTASDVDHAALKTSANDSL